MNIKAQWTIILAAGVLALKRPQRRRSIDAGGTAKTVSARTSTAGQATFPRLQERRRPRTLAFYKTTGVKMLRLNNGNNASKYNYESISPPTRTGTATSIPWTGTRARRTSPRAPRRAGILRPFPSRMDKNDKSHNFARLALQRIPWWAASQTTGQVPQPFPAQEKNLQTPQTSLYPKTDDTGLGSGHPGTFLWLR